MSGSFTYPGVYIQEIASPVHTITGVPTSVTAFVGVASRGPSGLPTTISSAADYVRQFGGSTGTPLDQAILLYYANGGSQAIVVRLGSTETDTTASVTLDGGPTLTANSAGIWGNNLLARVDYAGLPTLAGEQRYNLTLFDPVSSTTERYVGVSPELSSSRSLPRVLLNSALATVTSGADKRPKANADPPNPANPFAPLKQQAPAGGTGAGTGGTTPPAGTAPAGTPPVAADASKAPYETFSGGKNPAITDAAFTGDNATTGFYALAAHDTAFNLLVLTPLPGELDVPAPALQAAAAFAVRHRAFLIADAPSTWPRAVTTDLRGAFADGFGANNTNVAVYFPRVTVTDPLGGTIDDVGASAAIAGIYAATDASRGVWKAPAGIATQLAGITDLSVRLSDGDSGQLNPIAINCLRTLPVIGNVVWGARTLAGDDISASPWKYVPVRRTALFIEESLFQGTKWAVFEPNDEPLWAQVRLNVGAFMQTLFRQGAFQGSSAKDAYFVRCDATTNPQADIDRGILNILVGFAPLKPAEFVVIKLQQAVAAPTA